MNTLLFGTILRISRRLSTFLPSLIAIVFYAAGVAEARTWLSGPNSSPEDLPNGIGFLVAASSGLCLSLCIFVFSLRRQIESAWRSTVTVAWIQFKVLLGVTSVTLPPITMAVVAYDEWENNPARVENIVTITAYLVFSIGFVCWGGRLLWSAAMYCRNSLPAAEGTGSVPTEAAEPLEPRPIAHVRSPHTECLDDEREQARGSLKWIRIAVNERTAVLDRHVKDALKLHKTDTITWVSPLRNEGYKEYCDLAFLKKLEIELDPQQLFDFWPRSGPRWDALGRTSRGTRLLVEAKANVPELVSPGTGAGGDSRILIERSLVETQRFLCVDESIPWSGKLYQYANRLSHLFFLRERCGIDAHLIFVYFINDPDMSGPKTEEEWRAAIDVAEKVLGLGKRHALSDHVSDVFIDVRDLM